MEKIVTAAGGPMGLRKRFQEDEGAFRVENPPYMRLVVEYVGLWKEGHLISFAHYYEQNGDLMRDPEIVFLIVEGTGAGWYPTECTQDPMGGYTRVCWHDEDSGNLVTAVSAHSGVSALARTWDRNLGSQGFVKIAQDSWASRILEESAKL